MAGSEERTALNGLEKKLFKLMAKGATKAQWAEWLRAPLEHALADGDKSLALTLLAAGAGGAGWKRCNGRTLLGAAAEGGNHEIVSAILEAGGLEELDTVSGEEGMTALHHAIAGGHTNAARVLVVAGADVGLLDNRNRSALHYAMKGGHLQLAEYVVVGGADLNAKDADGDTPLHLAAAHDDQAFATTLLRRGASTNATNEKGQHPLHVAVEHDRIAVAEALLKAGADPNVLDADGNTPLILARFKLAMTRSLLKNGADTKLVSSFGCTALHWAGEEGEAAVVEALVEAGADVEARSGVIYYTKSGACTEFTPLHAAALLRNPGGMSALLRKGANVNEIDGDGRTPLHLVCKVSANDTSANDNSKTTAAAAELLLRWGADETLTDNNGRTPNQLIESVPLTSLVRTVLAKAPADRAWRRRGMLAICRAFPDKMSTKGGKGRAGKAKAGRGRGRGRWRGRGRGRGRGGGSAGVGRGRGTDVLTRVVDLDDDAIFRTIVGFL